MYGSGTGYRSPDSFTPRYHAVVRDWISRVNAAGGSASTPELNALDRMVKSWESDSLIESGLTTGAVSGSSIIQICLPCCGSNSIAASQLLLYRSGTASSVTAASSPSWDGANKRWSVSAGRFTHNYNPSLYSSSNWKGFVCVRSGTAAEATANPYYGTYTGSDLMIIGVNNSSRAGATLYRLYNSAVGLSAATNTGVSVSTFLANNYSADNGTTVSRTAHQGLTQVASSTTAGGVVPNSTLRLPDENCSNPLSFFACSVEGIPTDKITSFIQSIENFRSAIA